jgi:L-rhamnose isomerase/sugar isomerase
LVDRKKLRDAQTATNIIDAEECLRTAFFTDVKPILADWRKKKGLDGDPMKAYRASGYESRVAKEREAARAARGVKAGGSYA